MLLTKDGVPLVEGRDYRFGYDAASNTIRLTPIAGIWEEDSVYVARMLDVTDSVLRLGAGTTFVDATTTTLLTLSNQLVTLEVETGISIAVDTRPAFGAFDGLGIRIFDGTFPLAFELDSDGLFSGDGIRVPLAANSTAEQIAIALVAAINGTALNVTARSVALRSSCSGLRP